MNRNLTAGIVIALVVFAEVLLIVEAEFVWWHVLVGFGASSMLGAGALLSRNAFVIFAVVLGAVLGVYFGYKFELDGLAPGVIGGVLVSGLFQWGWFGPYGEHYRSERGKLAATLERGRAPGGDS